MSKQGGRRPGPSKEVARLIIVTALIVAFLLIVSASVFTHNNNAQPLLPVVSGLLGAVIGYYFKNDIPQTPPRLIDDDTE